MEKRYYIAYGSNLNVRQMMRRCPESRVIGTGTLNGWELLFKGSKTGAYLTIEQNPDGTVPVASLIVQAEACCRSAFSSTAGSFLPRTEALRRIP